VGTRGFALAAAVVLTGCGAAPTRPAAVLADLSLGEGYAAVTDVAADSQGRTVVAAVVPGQHAGVIRLTPGLERDATFGDHGLVHPPFDLGAEALALDGPAVLVTGSQGGSMAVTRYDASGRLDQRFGDRGTARLAVGRTGTVATPHALRIDHAGRIVVAGVVGEPTNPTKDVLAVGRLQPDGRPDTSFGTGGVMSSELLGGVRFSQALALDSAGRPLVVGFGVPYVPVGAQGGSASAVVRLTESGATDPSFGDGGRILVRSVYGGGVLGVLGVTTTPWGGTVLAGGADPDGSHPEVVLAGLDDQGNLDPLFGDGGTAVIRLARKTEAAAVTVLDDAVSLVVRSTEDAISSRPAWGWSLLRIGRDGRISGRAGAPAVDGRTIKAAVGSGGQLILGGCTCPEPAITRGNRESLSAISVLRVPAP